MYATTKNQPAVSFRVFVSCNILLINEYNLKFYKKKCLSLFWLKWYDPIQLLFVEQTILDQIFRILSGINKSVLILRLYDNDNNTHNYTLANAAYCLRQNCSIIQILLGWYICTYQYECVTVKLLWRKKVWRTVSLRSLAHKVSCVCFLIYNFISFLCLNMAKGHSIWQVSTRYGRANILKTNWSQH